MARAGDGEGKPSGAELGPGGEYFEEVYAPAESIYDGTWQQGTVPAEVTDFELMREMGWSWADLENTPAYVRKFCWDISQIRIAEQNRRAST